MAATLVGTPDAAASGTVTTVSVNLPAGITAGDIGVAGVVYNQTNGDPATPSGWTQFAPGEVTFSTSMRARFYYRTMTGGESGTLSFVHPSANKQSAAVAVLRGVSGTPTLATNSGNDTNPAASVAASSVAVSLWFERGGTIPSSVGAPSGFTLHDQAFGSGGGQTCAAVASNLTPSSSSVGGGSWTPNVANTGTITGTFALAETATGFTGTASFTGSGTLTATGTAVGAGAANLTGTGTLSATGTPSTTGTAAFTGTGVLVAAVDSPVARLTYPIYAAHRGGANISSRAENTTAAYALSIANDHPSTLLECDVAGLSAAGGEAAELRLALTHDGDDLSTNSRVREADGTTVVTGLSRDKTVTQWDSYLITQRSGISGPQQPSSRWWTNNPARPGLADLLLANPHKIAMPEIKEPEAEVPLLSSITALGLVGRTIVQAFDYATAQRVAAGGYNALWLTNSFATNSAAAVYASGIRWVGVDRTIADLAGYCTAAHAAGLKVIAYTVNSTANRDTAQAAGVDGFFTDRPDIVNTGVGATVPLSGSGTLTATGVASSAATAALSGSGTLTATGTASTTGAASLSGSGTLSAAGGSALSGAVTLSGSGALTATGAPTFTGTAALSGSGTLTTSGAPTVTRTATLTGSGTLTAAGVAAFSRSIDLTGTGLLTAVGSANQAGAATVGLSGTGTLTGTGTPATVGMVNLTGAGTLAATGHAALAGTATLTGTGTLTAAALPALAAAAQLAGLGTLTATGAAAADGDGTGLPRGVLTTTLPVTALISTIPATRLETTV